MTRAAWQRPAEWCLAALAASWRYEIVGAEHRDRALASGAPVVWAHWHGHLLPLFWLHRHRGLTVLISRHRDGGRLVDLARRWGYRTLRGSSTRGAVAGLLGLARALRQGEQIAMAVDGPLGPHHVAKGGALAVARWSEASVVAVAASARPAWRARSWDGFLVPAPGARVRVVYTAPWQASGATAPGLAELADRSPSAPGRSSSVSTQGKRGSGSEEHTSPIQERLDWATRRAAG